MLTRTEEKALVKQTLDGLEVSCKALFKLTENIIGDTERARAEHIFSQVQGALDHARGMEIRLKNGSRTARSKRFQSFKAYQAKERYEALRKR